MGWRGQLFAADCLFACLFVCLLACLFACLLVCLFACLLLDGVALTIGIWMYSYHRLIVLCDCQLSHVGCGLCVVQRLVAIYGFDPVCFTFDFIGF